MVKTFNLYSYITAIERIRIIYTKISTNYIIHSKHHISLQQYCIESIIPSNMSPVTIDIISLAMPVILDKLTSVTISRGRQLGKSTIAAQYERMTNEYITNNHTVAVN